MYFNLLVSVIVHHLLWFFIGFIGAIWAGIDASERGKPAIVVFLVVLIWGPIGILMWIAFRPEYQKK